jgi:colanic acid/amylovoran biosynthesis glycosyltransferase
LGYEKAMDGQREAAEGVSAGKTVAVFVTNFLPYSQTFIHDELVNHRRYRAEVFAWRRFHPERFPFQPVHRAGPLYPLWGASRAFDRIFAARRFDVVHAHFGPAGVLAHRYARRYRRPLVVTFHGYDVPLLGSLGRFHPAWIGYALGARQMLDDMTLGLCASAELVELLVAHGVSRDKLVRHPVGIDVDRFAFAPERADGQHALMVGRFVEKKGFVYGIEAFAHVAKQVPSATLSIIGDGPLRAQLERRAQQLGIAQRVRFLGVRAPREVSQALHGAAVLLAPSVVARSGDRESGLVVVKEASACGTVPIGSRHGGIPEIIDDAQTGFLVAERDVDGLAQRLQRVFEQPDLRRALALAGRRKIEAEYDVRRLVAALEDRYDALS